VHIVDILVVVVRGIGHLAASGRIDDELGYAVCKNSSMILAQSFARGMNEELCSIFVIGQYRH
jgi:hypothetical protein